MYDLTTMSAKPKAYLSWEAFDKSCANYDQGALAPHERLLCYTVSVLRHYPYNPLPKILVPFTKRNKQLDPQKFDTYFIDQAGICANPSLIRWILPCDASDTPSPFGSKKPLFSEKIILWAHMVNYCLHPDDATLANKLESFLASRCQKDALYHDFISDGQLVALAHQSPNPSLHALFSKYLTTPSRAQCIPYPKHLQKKEADKAQATKRFIQRYGGDREKAEHILIRLQRQFRQKKRSFTFQQSLQKHFGLTKAQALSAYHPENLLSFLPHVEEAEQIMLSQYLYAYHDKQRLYHADQHPTKDLIPMDSKAQYKAADAHFKAKKSQCKSEVKTERGQLFLRMIDCIIASDQKAPWMPFIRTLTPKQYTTSIADHGLLAQVNLRQSYIASQAALSACDIKVSDQYAICFGRGDGLIDKNCMKENTVEWTLRTPQILASLPTHAFTKQCDLGLVDKQHISHWETFNRSYDFSLTYPVRMTEPNQAEMSLFHTRRGRFIPNTILRAPKYDLIHHLPHLHAALHTLNFFRFIKDPICLNDLQRLDDHGLEKQLRDLHDAMTYAIEWNFYRAYRMSFDHMEKIQVFHKKGSYGDPILQFTLTMAKLKTDLTRGVTDCLDQIKTHLPELLNSGRFIAWMKQQTSYPAITARLDAMASSCCQPTDHLGRPGSESLTRHTQVTIPKTHPRFS